MDSIRINNIIVDGTVHGALYMTVQLTNLGFIAHDYHISVVNCPVMCGNHISLKKKLTPHREITVDFNLPLELLINEKEYSCESIGKNITNNIILKNKYKINLLNLQFK